MKKYQLTEKKDQTLIKPYSVTFISNNGEQATVAF